jgi:hypothetical protein
MKYRFRIITLIALSFLLSSCEADIDMDNISNDIALHPGLIVPIGSASVTLGQLFSNNYDGSNLDFSDSQEINFVSVDSFEFKLPPLNFPDSALPFTKDLHPSAVAVSTLLPYSIIPTVVSNDYLNLGLNASTNADRLDSLKINSATLAFTISVSPEMLGINPSDMKISIIFPTDKLRMLKGNSNTITFTPTLYGVPVSVVIPNCVLNTLGRASGVPMQIKVEGTNGSSILILTPASIITCNIVLKQLDYSVAYGQFSSLTNISTTLQRTLDVARVFPDGLLKFLNPKITISASSNIGTYLNFQVDYLKAFLSTDLTIAPVYAWFNNHTTNSISEQFDEKPKLPGLWVNKTFKPFDKDWGETDKLFENIAKPDRTEYKFSASVNESLVQNDPSPSFVTPDSKFKVKISTQIPFYLSKSSYYEFRDTIPNLIESIASKIDSTSHNKVNLTALVLSIKNGLPVNATLSLKFVDLVGNELITDFKKDYTVFSGKVDSGGIVQFGSETNQTLIVSVSKAQLSELKNAKSLVYTVRIEGKDVSSNIHFTQWNTFDLQVGLFVKADLTVNSKIITQN